MRRGFICLARSFGWDPNRFRFPPMKAFQKPQELNYFFGENMIPYRTESVHFFWLMNSTTNM